MFEVNKKYKGAVTNIIYTCVFADGLGGLLAYVKDCQSTRDFVNHTLANKSKGLYEEYNEPVIEVRYGRAILYDYKDLGYDVRANTTSWTRKKSVPDNVKATFVDGKLNSLEIVS
jgi:hypothetical protein